MRKAITAGLFMVVLGCKDTASPPAEGELRVTVTTGGVDAPSTYAVTVGEERFFVSVNGSLTRRLRVGTHSVTIETNRQNCSTVGPSTRVAEVTNSGVVTVPFDVACGALTGDMEVVTATSGVDGPLTYRVAIDGVLLATPIGANAVQIVPGLAGNHQISLESLGGNCSVSDGASRSVMVATGGQTRDTVRIRFDVSCVATSGVIEVRTASNGLDIDMSGYEIGVAAERQRVTANGGANFPDMLAGTYSVTIGDVASNCAISGGSSRQVTVSTGGRIRDTARVSFVANCAAVQKIAFARYDANGEPMITVAHADGTEAIGLETGTAPAWSPDGAKILYASVVCDGDYYGCWLSGLAIIDADGTNLRQVTRGMDHDPAWHPDGSRIAFVRHYPSSTLSSLVLRSMHDGSEVVIQLSEVRYVSRPAWSPDGSRIAFVCSITHVWNDICVLNLESGAIARLTADPWNDGSPSWRPDGSLIAFHTDRDIRTGELHVATMAPDGSSFTRLGSGWSPSFSADGSKIVFAERGLWVMSSTGAGRTRITMEAGDVSPVWRGR